MNMSTGWNFFFALLIADIAGAAAMWFGLEGKAPWIVGAVVFVLFALLFSLSSLKHRRKNKKNVEETPAPVTPDPLNNNETPKTIC